MLANFFALLNSSYSMHLAHLSSFFFYLSSIRYIRFYPFVVATVFARHTHFVLVFDFHGTVETRRLNAL